MAFGFGMAAGIERSLISAPTSEAWARKNAEGVVLGRPAGTKLDPTRRKLYGKMSRFLTGWKNEYLSRSWPVCLTSTVTHIN